MTTPVLSAHRAGTSNRSRWVVLILLIAATVTNLIDRQLPFILGAQLKAEFGLSDGQLGLLGGVAFSLVYAIGAIPLARIADRGSRKIVLGCCMATWSLMTALGSFAQSFLTLAITRSGVALGEAGATPVSHSMIADLFGERQRGLAISLFTIGVPIGIMLGMGIGGLLAKSFDWRAVLLMASVPGLLLAAVFLLWVKEPPRSGKAADRAMPLGDAVRWLLTKRAFPWIAIASTLVTFSGAGAATFGAMFLMRSRGLDIAEAGIVFGILFGMTAIVGSLTNGALGDRLARRDIRWRLWLPALAMVVMAPAYACVWLADSNAVGYAAMVIAFLCLGFYLPASYTALQSMSEPSTRAFASASLQLILNLIGNVLGPILFGTLSDHLSGRYGDQSLGYSLACGSVLPLLAALAYGRAATLYPSDLPLPAPVTAEID